MKATVRTLLCLVVLTAKAEAPGAICEAELASKWRKFASDANAYLQSRDTIIDSKLRGRLPKEFNDVINCWCW